MNSISLKRPPDEVHGIVVIHTENNLLTGKNRYIFIYTQQGFNMQRIKSYGILGKF